MADTHSNCIGSKTKCLSVCPMQKLENHSTYNLDIWCVDASWVGDWTFFKPTWCYQNYANELKILQKRSKVFFFKTAGQTALIFGIQVPRDDLIQICSNCDEICNFVFLRLFLPFLVKKSSSSKPLVRHLWNLVYKSPGLT